MTDCQYLAPGSSAGYCPHTTGVSMVRNRGESLPRNQGVTFIRYVHKGFNERVVGWLPWTRIVQHDLVLICPAVNVFRNELATSVNLDTFGNRAVLPF